MVWPLAVQITLSSGTHFMLEKFAVNLTVAPKDGAVLLRLRLPELVDVDAAGTRLSVPKPTTAAVAAAIGIATNVRPKRDKNVNIGCATPSVPRWARITSICKNSCRSVGNSARVRPSSACCGG